MDKAQKFKAFMESLRTEQNAKVIDTILEGFSIIHEAGYVELDEGITRGAKVDQTANVTFKQGIARDIEMLHNAVGDSGDHRLESAIVSLAQAVRNGKVELYRKLLNEVKSSLNQPSSPAFGTRGWGIASDIANKLDKVLPL